MKKVALASLLAIFSLVVSVTVVSAQQPKVKSFVQWCKQRNSVSAPTKHTIDVLLKRAGTDNCQQADLQLNSSTTLILTRTKIVDLKPLASLTNLTFLLLDHNEITDITPLASMSNLAFLNLSFNKIVDIKPLAKLTNITHLSLMMNKIVDVKPLGSLTNLTEVWLMGNQITPKDCPPQIASVCKF